MSIAFVFPGQGAQTIGMGRALAEAYPAAQAIFDPPSIRRVSPVMKAAASDNKKQMAALISASLPKRRAGKC